MLTIGLDVHQSKTSVCVMDGKGNILREQEVLGGYGAVAEALSKLRKPFQVCYEASTGYGALHERMGHITREGPPTVRKLLTEAGWRGSRESATIKEVFARLCVGTRVGGSWRLWRRDIGCAG